MVQPIADVGKQDLGTWCHLTTRKRPLEGTRQNDGMDMSNGLDEPVPGKRRRFPAVERAMMASLLAVLLAAVAASVYTTTVGPTLLPPAAQEVGSGGGNRGGAEGLSSVGTLGGGRPESGEGACPAFCSDSSSPVIPNP